MITSITNTHEPRQQLSPDLLGMAGHLLRLIGEPFKLARVSYGDELTLHFGELRRARSQNLKDKMYGAYILGVCASSWLIKSDCGPLILTDGALAQTALEAIGTPTSKESLESNPVIEPETRVLSATPFVVKASNGFGLHVQMSDSSSFLILPSPSEPDEPEDEGSTPLEDWELVCSQGVLKAGPGLVWSFERTDTSTPA
jgi:hypothetical protein